MFQPRIAIFGASGFVGSALVERLFFDSHYAFTAAIHSFGNAWRIARLRVPMRCVNVLSFDEVNDLVKGHNVVVNCSRGDDATMLRGLRNITRAARKHGVEKFIHLSSLAIYGADPPPESAHERQPPDPGNNVYGIIKLRQDEWVLREHRAGLNSLILCPPNISGPYSSFVRGAAEALLQRKAALVDHGRNPCNLIHVDNLVEAILAGVRSESGFGERYFVNEVEQITWREYYEELQAMLGEEFEIPVVARAHLLESQRNTKRDSGLMANVRTIFSGEFRRALSMMPWFASLNQSAHRRFTTLDPSLQRKLRRRFQKPLSVAREDRWPNLGQHMIRAQLDTVYHSPRKLVEKLGYRPLLNRAQRRETLIRFFEFAPPRQP